MRIVFLGSGILGSAVLKALVNAKINVVLTITETSKAGNRGIFTEPIVKKISDEFKIPCAQFEKVCKEGLSVLREFKPDLFVTASYSHILTEEFLSIAKTINVHPSLLPLHRGATPIQSAILAGDKVTGVTILNTVKALDAGDIILQEKFDIIDGETSGELFERASNIGAELCVKAVKQIENGAEKYVSQDNAMATICKKINKEDAKINFSKTAEELVNFIRAYNPWPVAFSKYEGKLFKIFKANVVKEKNISDTMLFKAISQLKQGEIFSTKNQIFVGCGVHEALEFQEIQIENGKKLPATAFLCGKKLIGGFDDFKQ